MYFHGNRDRGRKVAQEKEMRSWKKQGLLKTLTGWDMLKMCKTASFCFVLVGNGRHVGVKGVVFGRTRPQKQGHHH